MGQKSRKKISSTYNIIEARKTKILFIYTSGSYDTVHTSSARQQRHGLLPLHNTSLCFSQNSVLFSSHALTQPRELAFLRHKPFLLFLGQTTIIVTFPS